MPKDGKPTNLFFKKSVTGHLGGSHSSDHSENSRTSTPTASEDEGSRPGRTNVDNKPPVVEPHRAAKPPLPELSLEHGTDESSSSTNVSTPTSTTSSDRDSIRSRDSNSSPAKTNKRPMKQKKDMGRGTYSSHRGSYGRQGGRQPGDRRDVARMNYFRGPPRPMFHRPPPPPPHPHFIEHHLSQSPREHAPFIVPVSSPRRTPRHSESSSCGSPLQSNMHFSTNTPPHSPQQHFYESPVSSPLRHRISPYNSPPRRSPAPRMVHAEMMHHGMIPAQHPIMQGQRIAFPIPQGHEMRQFAGTPPQFMGNPPPMVMMEQQIRPMPLTPEQQHIMQNMMQQKAVAEQMEMRKQQEMQQMAMQMNQMTMQGQSVTFTPEQYQQFMQYITSHNMQGGQRMPVAHVQQEMLQQHAMMMNQQNNNQIPPLNAAEHQFFQNNVMAGPQMGQMTPQAQMRLQQHQFALMNHQMGQAQNHQAQFPLGGHQPIMVPQPLHPDAAFMNHQISSPQNSPNHHHMNMVAQNMEGFTGSIAGVRHAAPHPHQAQHQLAMGQHNSPVQTQIFIPPASQSVPSPSLPQENNRAQSPNVPREEQQTTPQPPAEVEPSEQNEAPRRVATADPAPVDTVSPTSPTTVEVAIQVQRSQKPATTAPAPVAATELVTPVKHPPKTPGLIRLPPQLPTEEEMMKSPEAGGTPVALKKNYWQRRQKSTNSSETIKESPGDVSKNLPMEKEIVNPPAPEVRVLSGGGAVSSPVPEVKEEAGKESPVVAQDARKPKVKPKSFNLSDLGELVTNTVKHNSTIPKTDISTGSVEVVLNQGFRKLQGPAPSTSSSSSVRVKQQEKVEERETWRPLSRDQKAPSESTSSWRNNSNKHDDRDKKTYNDDRQGKSPKSRTTSNSDDAASLRAQALREAEGAQALKEAEAKDLSTGQQIQYALEKLQSTSPAPRTMSESSSKSTKEELPEEPWYDENDEDEIDCFDLTI